MGALGEIRSSLSGVEKVQIQDHLQSCHRAMTYRLQIYWGKGGGAWTQAGLRRSPFPSKQTNLFLTFFFCWENVVSL